MEVKEFFPFWDKLTKDQQDRMIQAAVQRKVPEGAVLHNGSADCLGLILVCGGQLRVYLVSPEGREITLYRLFERDICLLSASCMMRNIQFDVIVEAEKDSLVWIIPPEIYRGIMEQSAAAANYTNELMSQNFSEVMWVMEQIMWNSFDRRLADFLLEEGVLEGSDSLKITHERIANHLGSAREVATRMLRYFQREGLVHLSRGEIQIVNKEGLQNI